VGGNPLTENARGGMLTIKTMSLATSSTVSSAFDHDATMEEACGEPAGSITGPEAGEMERKADAVGSIKRHEK